MTEAAATPGATSNDTPIVSSLSRLGRVLFSPGQVFDELDRKPTFWEPWLIVSIIYAILNYFQRPFQQRIGQLMMERAGQTPPPDTMAKALISAALTPLGVLFICVVSGAILYGLAAAMGGSSSFKRMMTVSIFTWPVLLIQTLITVLVLMSRGVGSIQGPQDMMVSFGLDLLLPAETTMGWFPRLMLAGIGPLQIWGVVIAAVGVQIMAKTSKGAGWAVAIIHYLIILSCLSALGAFGFKMMESAAR